MSIEVRDAPDPHRYEAVVDGTVAGFAVYRDYSGVRVFTHTEVFPAFEGRGVGSALARGALDHVRASGRTLVAQCPFIRSYIERQPEYADLVDADLDARLTSR
ncbi:MAG TPA: GNAT family N-acetyltransferase [Acidimicrobiales bacterium]|nr:GNAT family N-acetyltransferase [Acidimicrobiales bacterium]